MKGFAQSVTARDGESWASGLQEAIKEILMRGVVPVQKTTEGYYLLRKKGEREECIFDLYLNKETLEPPKN